MKRKSKDSKNSGQALIVTSLIITMLLLSTAYYVFEIDKNVADNPTAVDYAFLATKLSTLNTIVSALANVSNGGERAILMANLNELSSAIRSHSYDAECLLLFTPLDSPQYQDGIETSWGSSGLGISSAYVGFSLNVTGLSVSYYSEFETNVTAGLNIDGSFTGSGSEKSVNATCRVYDEKGLALASDITLFYQNETSGAWISLSPSNSLNITDYGDGTYFMSFNVNTQNVLNLSAHVHDSRGIFVMANVTCSMA